MVVLRGLELQRCGVAPECTRLDQAAWASLCESTAASQHTSAAALGPKDQSAINSGLTLQIEG